MAAMPTLTIKAFTKTFFTTSTVTNAVDKATKKALSLAGGKIRLTARRSIRTRKAPSAPGAPPSSHSGLLKRNIFYGYDQQNRSLVVGPAKLNGVTLSPGLAPILAPNALEFGGVTSRLEQREAGGNTPWEKADYRLIPSRRALAIYRETRNYKAIVTLNYSPGATQLGYYSRSKGRFVQYTGKGAKLKHAEMVHEFRLTRATIAARPFMGPALQRNLSYIPSAFANSLTK